MINWDYVAKAETKAVSVLTKMCDDLVTPHIEFSSWTINSEVGYRVSAGISMPTNVFMWYDAISGFWVLFCGNYMKWGNMDRLPIIGQDVINHGWKQFGFGE